MFSSYCKNITQSYWQKSPYLVHEWQDDLTNARGWLVINSFKGSAAGGGTRMRPGLTKEEVVLLSKTMELKFSIAQPHIGGAKGGIDFDPQDPRKHEVLLRWYRSIQRLLESCYGTAGDLNVCQQNDVIPICRHLGIIHPQQGILAGHFKFDNDQMRQKLQTLSRWMTTSYYDIAYGLQGYPNKLTQLVVGYSICESIEHFRAYFKQQFANNNVVIQGWGRIGAAAGYYLSKCGYTIIGILEKNGGIIAPQGLTCEQVTNLYKNGEEALKAHHCYFEGDNLTLINYLSISIDIFVPCASSFTIDRHLVNALFKRETKLFCCGANLPFNTDGSQALLEYVDKETSLIPDFLASIGMARVFYSLMSGGVNDVHAVFQDISKVIDQHMRALYKQSDNVNGIYQRLLSFCLKADELP